MLLAPPRLLGGLQWEFLFAYHDEPTVVLFAARGAGIIAPDDELSAIALRERLFPPLRRDKGGGDRTVGVAPPGDELRPRKLAKRLKL